MALAGKIAIVTGASRGIGKGIALQLGTAGATVLVTGREPGKSQNEKAGLPSLEQTANKISQRGGRGIAFYVDHSDMKQVKSFFESVEEQFEGQLDILVNNAYSAVTAVLNETGKKFYESDPELWDTVNNVGLRNHYFCSVYGARMMVKRKRGLIVNVSSAGGLTYVMNVPYGVGKEALDRMAVDEAIELKDAGVAAVSLWPGAVKTQLITEEMKNPAYANSMLGKMFHDGESTEFVGKAVVALASDKKVMKKSGRVLHTGDLANEYGFVDIDGRLPPNMRSVSTALKMWGWDRLANITPSFIKAPGVVMTAMYSKI